VILKSFFGQTQEERFKKMKMIDGELNKNSERINKAMQMMLDGILDAGEYRAIKSKYDSQNTTLLRERASLEIDRVDYKTTIKGSVNLLRHLDKFYKEASVDIKQKLVGLIFTEKLILKMINFKPLAMNEIVSLIMLESNELVAEKKGPKKNFSLQSPVVSLQGFKPRVF
jgi:site-specific DNA recombinase